MPAPTHIELTYEEDQTLQASSEADDVPRCTKQRAIALRLNATGWWVPQIIKYLDCAESTVRQNLSRWQKDGLAGRVFEDDFDLAMTIVEGMESRALQGQYVIKRFIFTQVELLTTSQRIGG